MLFPSVGLFALAATAAAVCDLPSTYRWSDYGGILAKPTEEVGFAIGQLTHVPYKGKHLVYATRRDQQAWGSMSFGLFDSWDQMANATQFRHTNATIAPTLFHFTPKNIWILAYQWGPMPFTYKTSKDPSNPNGWSEALPLWTDTTIPTQSPTGPLDQTLIGDDKSMYLFYAANNGRVYRASMPIGNFPGNFGKSSEIVLNDTNKANLFEAVQVYKLKGLKKYLMIVEAIGSRGRYMRSYTASSLGGAWTPQAVHETNPFVGKANSGSVWTNDISHGDLIRSTADQKMEIDACKLQFLHEGRDPNDFSPGFAKLPYRPGLLTLQNPVRLS
jgi:hypothetical protein